MTIYSDIERLISFGVNNHLLEEDDVIYTRNSLLEILELDEWEEVNVPNEELNSPAVILESILDWAADQGKLTANTVTYRDLLDTKIMSRLLPRPSEVRKKFRTLYETKGPEHATKFLYQFSEYSHYIRTDRINKNEHWYAPTEYGDLEITINLSKPEKDPTAIANAKLIKSSSYPDCLLCKENEGYAGRVNHPARQNLRIIPFTLGVETWFLQFSPYVYYNEHAIVFLDEHKPMKISKRTFEKLLEFVEQVPHYFLGSNADLPIVGGSILSHDHYQGGNHDFPMAKAEIEKTFSFKQYPNVSAGIVKWPMSVIRIQSENRLELIELANIILSNWIEYSDESVGIHAYTNDVRHNTITPIARKRGSYFELDLVLRNNRTSDEHPLGIYHPHAEVHHIKKENIGLIEVMGLAVLPGRLQEELKLLGEAMVHNNFKEEIIKNEIIAKHLEWAVEIKERYEELNPNNVDEILKKEVGIVFGTILEHCGVFKRDDEGGQAFVRFLESI